MVLTTKYPVFKGTIAGSGVASVSEATEKTVTIPHGLGYIPSVAFLVNSYGIVDPKQYHPTPYYDSGGSYTIYYYAYADDTNVYLVLFLELFGTGPYDVDYIYRIYLDKGKL
jgi:hypothetical protein